ncbi:cilia- and flagella-associated protein 52 isoform X2 [Belonocnema kinseyi]|uniref:cilia- and flagella-associated protein 52 isoform X2 n=1 Tax=Belonocnema kinseyi TaxID=2817044 RepID=UPI00143DB2C6|nr:cilia- and flagella-associated protein 52 isoform X2 [Belonocnema kinseyi]
MMSGNYEDTELKDLDLTGIISFDGITRNSLHVHPDQEHLLFPMGNKVTIKSIASGTQSFLSGHTNLISALCLSPCGKFIASGQINHLGFKAMVIIWNYHEKKMKSSHEIHQVRVEDLCFSCESNYLISLGGRDDGNVVIWDVHNDEAICEISGSAWTIRRTNMRDQCFISGGENTLKVWRMNPETRKLYGMNVKVGKIKRSINCVVINNRDEVAYCGTASGDIIKARLNYYHNMEHMEPVQSPIMIGCYSKIPKDPRKMKTGMGDLYPGGVKTLLLLDDEKILVGSGGGNIELIKIVDIPINFNKGVKLPSTPQIQTLRSEHVGATVSSMVRYKTEYVLIGTSSCEIYQIKLKNFDMRLLVTCHTNTIYGISFPQNYSEIFATGSKNDIRLWRVETRKELLRITVPNFVCSNLYFSYDGTMIISAWNDGVIRAFTPQTGRLLFAICNAHLKAVSAVVITKDGKTVVSAGSDGQVRIWNIKPDVQRLVCVLKEHRGPVTSLYIASNDKEVISSSIDGTCIIWDIGQCARKQVLVGNTMYMAAIFSPNNFQVITCGTDRKIAYWEILNGSLIRELEGSGIGALNCVDISPDCQYFVTGSNDSIVKLWHYQTGEITHIGLGHAAIITGIKFSPDAKNIVSVSADGAIMIWKCPFELKMEETSRESCRSKSTCSIREQEWNNLRLEKLDDQENIAKLTPCSESAKSVKAIHEGNNIISPNPSQFSTSSSHSYTSKHSSNRCKSDSNKKIVYEPIQSCNKAKCNPIQICQSADMKCNPNSPCVSVASKISSRLEETRTKSLKSVKCEMVLASPCPRK